jgi:NADPH:quinone reductase-like Zn-dependent oxidoreductase
MCMIEPMGSLNGKTVLVVGAGGGVGSFATQLAVTDGARVIATVRSSAAQRILDYGAMTTVDHTTGPIAAQVREIAPDGIDVYLHTASDDSPVEEVSELVREGGFVATIASIIDVEKLAARGITGIMPYSVSPRREQLERLGVMVAAGELHVPITHRVSLEGAIEAVVASRNGHADGKTVVLPYMT